MDAIRTASLTKYYGKARGITAQEYPARACRCKRRLPTAYNRPQPEFPAFSAGYPYRKFQHALSRAGSARAEGPEYVRSISARIYPGLFISAGLLKNGK